VLVILTTPALARLAAQSESEIAAVLFDLFVLEPPDVPSRDRGVARTRDTVLAVAFRCRVNAVAVDQQLA